MTPDPELDRLMLWFLPMARYRHEVRLACRVFDSAGDEGRRLAIDANERFVAPKPEARPHGGLVLLRS